MDGTDESDRVAPRPEPINLDTNQRARSHTPCLCRVGRRDTVTACVASLDRRAPVDLPAHLGIERQPAGDYQAFTRAGRGRSGAMRTTGTRKSLVVAAGATGDRAPLPRTHLGAVDTAPRCAGSSSGFHALGSRSNDLLRPCSFWTSDAAEVGAGCHRTPARVAAVPGHRMGSGG